MLGTPVRPSRPGHSPSTVVCGSCVFGRQPHVRSNRLAPLFNGLPLRAPVPAPLNGDARSQRGWLGGACRRMLRCDEKV